ncbi:hypothetical protein [Archangium primigenium]|uniref:hypothetical protein n=1 Tax=[Archangium] primigenium TaxID=2792470 RepID=UPI00195BE92D|nr:hypothetical protein [Archangium primigenium]MBM7119312.1 hypothetical protein [Archangium primigenium]
MRTLALLGRGLLLLAAVGCSEPPAEGGEGPSGEGPPSDKPTETREFTLTLSDPQTTNARMGTHRMNVGSGQYAPGLSLLSTSSHPASGSAACLTVILTVSARPEAGKAWPILPRDFDAKSLPPETASLLLQDVCTSAGTHGQWVSTSGTVRIDTMADAEPGTGPGNLPPGAVKALRLRLVDVAMTPSPKGAPATGSFLVNGGGLIEPLFFYEAP